MNLALFDFDGTITTRETFPDFIQAAVPPRRLAVGKVVLAPLIVGYRLGLVPGTWVRSCIVWIGFRGVSQARVKAVAERFARDLLPGLIRPEALARIAWHQAQGDVVVVVSGGFDLVLSHWCALHGLELVCSRLESVDGVLTGRYLGPQCVGEEKPRRVRARFDLAIFGEIRAYGDTREDLPMLGIAHRKTYRWEPAA